MSNPVVHWEFWALQPQDVAESCPKVFGSKVDSNGAQR